MQTVFSRTPTLKDCTTHYCPGCGHGLAHRLVAEVIDELDIRSRTLGIAPVGCAVYAYDYIDVDMIEVPHGRAPAVATGMKRMRPNNIIFTYQGDGDLASIGAAEILHAANRGEKITVIFVNNAVYGMTGGQMAPTTLLDQVTATTPRGRSQQNDGFPLRICELLTVLPGTAYIERCSLHDPKHIRQVKKAIRRAFEHQVEDKPGLTLVELLSPCPTYWRKSPKEAMAWIANEMTKVFPLQCFKEPEKS
ncbi:MAG: 2-oxoglutarate oxidoreductase [Sedimentisphaerales bacterium]|nr:2-oxoglutarate oxidoreductase [Sedimentisphaerales bacterium]